MQVHSSRRGHLVWVSLLLGFVGFVFVFLPTGKAAGGQSKQPMAAPPAAPAKLVATDSYGMKVVGPERACALPACGVLRAASNGHVLGSRKPSALLGTGEGVNHVIIAVRSLDGAASLYHRTLGFTVTTGGTFSGGFANDMIRFENHTFLELLTVRNGEEARRSPEGAATMQFLERNQGAIMLGLGVSSASATAAYLRNRGFEVAGPIGGTYAPAGVKVTPPELWKQVDFSRPAVLGLPIFFIEYNRKAMAELAQQAPRLRASSENWTHANGATVLYAVWMAVKNLRNATKIYEKVGFMKGRVLELKQIGARGQEIAAGAGKIILVAPQGANGPAARFERSRESFPLGESVMGVSIEVKNLAATRSLLEERYHGKLATYKFATYAGPYGESLLVPAKFTSGVWIEFFQKRK